MKATLTAEHAWLQRLIGAWEVEMPGPDGTTARGSETGRALGPAWVLLEGNAQMPDGSSAQMLMTLGYDPVQRCFVGSWVGSMMNHLWVYRGGSLDAAQRLLSLPSEGPAFDRPEATVPFRDEIEWVSDDERLLHGNQLAADGQWQRFMTARYRRVR